MLNIPQRVTGITHPHVKEIYLKQEYHADTREQRVLVIETSDHDDKDNHEMFDSYLIDLLGDLRNLQIQAAGKVGKIDRVDIRTH
jgi:hypothetical protein